MLLTFALVCFLAGNLIGEKTRIRLWILDLYQVLKGEPVQDDYEKTSLDYERPTVVDTRSKEEREQAAAIAQHFFDEDDFRDEVTQHGERILVEVYWEEPDTFPMEERC